MRYLALLYLVLLPCFLVFVIWWARKKSREFRPGRNADEMQELFFKPLPRNFYVSVQFCVGFALAVLIAAVLFDFFART